MRPSAIFGALARLDPGPLAATSGVMRPGTVGACRECGTRTGDHVGEVRSPVRAVLPGGAARVARSIRRRPRDIGHPPPPALAADSISAPPHGAGRPAGHPHHACAVKERPLKVAAGRSRPARTPAARPQSFRHLSCRTGRRPPFAATAAKMSGAERKHTMDKTWMGLPRPGRSGGCTPAHEPSVRTSVRTGVAICRSWPPICRSALPG